MPRKVKEGLSVEVPLGATLSLGGQASSCSGRPGSGGKSGSGRGSVSGGRSGSGGKAVSPSKLSRSRRPRPFPFPVEKRRSPSQPHLPPYERYASELKKPEPVPRAGSVAISQALGAMHVTDDAPISARTRSRVKLGFPLQPSGALTMLENKGGEPQRKMATMSVAAARHCGAADARDAAAKARLTRASICGWMHISLEDISRPRGV